jgi:hypothetical protein
MQQLSHLLGEKLTDAIDEIEVYAVSNNHWLKVVEGNGHLQRKKLNVCVDTEGKISEFVFTD